jgi:hypothetical protein
VFLYDLSSLTSSGGIDESDIDSAVVLPAWKILDGHQLTGKAYGALFTSPQSPNTNASSLVTFGSDGTLQIWSVASEERRE